MVRTNSNNNQSLRALIYARVSTQGQSEEEVPLTAQIRECQDYCTSQGWQVVDVVEDGGISGRTEDRPGFQHMITLAKEKPRPFDIIVVWKAKPAVQEAGASNHLPGVASSAGYQSGVGEGAGVRRCPGVPGGVYPGSGG